MRLARVLLAVVFLLPLATLAGAQDGDVPDPFESDGSSGRTRRLRQIDEQVQREADANYEEPDPLDEEPDDFDDDDEADDDDGEPADPYDDGEREVELEPAAEDEAPVRRPKGPLDRGPLDPPPTGAGARDADD